MAVLFGLLVVSCYAPSVEDCQIKCGSGICPDGLTCQDGWCLTQDSVANGKRCAASQDAQVEDATTSDAPMQDAREDASDAGEVADADAGPDTGCSCVGISCGADDGCGSTCGDPCDRGCHCNNRSEDCDEAGEDCGGEHCDPCIVVERYRPTDDAFLVGNAIRAENYNVLRIGTANEKMRITYLRFDVTQTGTVGQATLRLWESGGSNRTGTWRVHLGDHANWTETTLSDSIRPAQQTLLDTLSATKGPYELYEWDVSGIQQRGIYTLIVSMGEQDGQDPAFWSKTGTTAPELEVVTTYR